RVMGPSKPYCRNSAAAVPPAWPAPRIATLAGSLIGPRCPKVTPASNYQPSPSRLRRGTGGGEAPRLLPLPPRSEEGEGRERERPPHHPIDQVQPTSAPPPIHAPACRARTGAASPRR